MKKTGIPKLAHRLFKWFCKEYLFEELAGDLEESFIRNKNIHGARRARKIYLREVFKMIRVSVIKRNTVNLPTNTLALFTSYLTIGTRSLVRHKLFSFVNIFSLSVAMSTGLLVIGMITDLSKFDEFHENKEEIYRIISTPTFNDKIQDQTAVSPLPLGEELRTQFPEIQVLQLGRRLVGEALANNKKLFVNGIYSDEHFFDFLSFELIKGNSDMVLKEPFSIVLSESFAEKSFKGKEAIGEVIAISGVGDFIVTGIAADPPKFSHIQFDIIGSLSTVNSLYKQGIIGDLYASWNNFDSYYNYVYIPDNKAKPRFLNWLIKTAPAYYLYPEEVAATFELQQLNKIVPGKDLSDQIGPKMINLPIIIMSAIAMAILLSAVFNYTNLSMARALRRAREVGVRKLSGASNRAVYMQFTVEAMILAIVSLCLGILLFTLIRPGFLELVPRASEVLKLELSVELVLWFTCFALLTGLIAGLAPSIFFMRISSLRALRGSGNLKTLSRINLRKGLIVAQFTLSIIFILALLIANKQYSYSLNKNMGFDSENILNISLMGNNHDVLKAGLEKIPEVTSVSFSSEIPGVGIHHYLLLVDPRIQDSVWVNNMSVDKEFIPNLNIELIAGRNFRLGENLHREQSILVNEAFVQRFGLEQPLDALGTVFTIKDNEVEIVGVVKDFHYDNLEDKIASFIFRNNAIYQYANVKLASTDIVNTVSRIEEVWAGIDPINKMRATFFDDLIEGYYRFFIDVMKLFGFIGFLAISISCLGLFGMAIYSTEIRMNEIAVRKSFGASEKALIILLSKGFLKLVILAIIIGTPICYFVFDKLILAQHYYRPDITIVEILLSSGILIGICLLTVVSQTWSAARTSPAKVLRDNN
jgi:ABC-type antimicrobial peptide transport system permease subunit